MTKHYPVTTAATLLAAAVCLFNATGRDPHNLIFFMISIPSWFADLLFDIHRVNVPLMYILTVLTWAVIGYVCDRLIQRGRGRAA